MFAYFKKRKSIADGEYMCRTMFAGIAERYGKPVPMTVFTDAYVIGFIEQVILHAMAINYRMAEPADDDVIKVGTAVFDKLTKGNAVTVLKASEAVNEPRHSFNGHYRTGASEARNYLRAISDEDQEASTALALSFRGYIVRNYLDMKPYA